jgi:predicted ATP-grasp superfamily ATP-dependent carboligase
VSPSVIVLDGEQRAALAVVRALGRRGCMIHVASAIPHSLAGGSRFAASESRLPDPLLGTEAYSTAVAGLLGEHQAQVVIPVTEASTLALLQRMDLFAGVRLPTSDLEHFRRASDKAAVLSLAERLGIPVPPQWTVSGHPDEVPPIPAERFPIVVKPTRSVTGPEGNRRKVGVRYAHTAVQLDQALRELGPEAGPFLLQTRAEGPGLGVFLLRWGGQVLASFAHRRIREKPPSGGVSVCCESVVAPDALLAQSKALLDALDWTGVAMIEYKHDIRSGQSYLMEINPRFWGSLQLAIDAGVDFPWYLMQAALGQRVEPVCQWRVGVRSRWCWGDMDHLIARLRHSRADLNLPADAPGVLQTAASVLLPWRPRQRSDVFRLSDPIPAVRESVAWVRALQHADAT